MGGYGSGRWGWHTKKHTVEKSWALDVGALLREGTLAPGVTRTGEWRWHNPRTNETLASVGFNLCAEDRGGWLRLFYTVTRAGGKVDADYRIPLVTTVPHFGGLRWWFTCPGEACRRRVRRLYLPPRGTYFLCRTCHDLTYVSSQAHDRTADRYRALDTETLLALAHNADDPITAIRAASVILDRTTNLYRRRR